MFNIVHYSSFIKPNQTVREFTLSSNFVIFFKVFIYLNLKETWIHKIIIFQLFHVLYYYVWINDYFGNESLILCSVPRGTTSCHSYNTLTCASYKNQWI